MINATRAEVVAAMEAVGFSIDPMSTETRVEGRAPDPLYATEFKLVATELLGMWRATIFIPDDFGRRPVYLKVTDLDDLKAKVRSHALRITEKAS